MNSIGFPTYIFAKYLVGKLKHLVGHIDSIVKNSTDMVDDIKRERIKEEDTLLSFNMVSLYTKILIEEAIKTIKEIIDKETMELVRVCLKSTFFTFRECFYEQVEGVAMGSLLSPIVANLFMEKFEKLAIDSYPLKPDMWKRYVDDTNVIWPHDKEDITGFFEHLNK